MEPSDTVNTVHEDHGRKDSQKRPRSLASDSRYPRKRSLKACHVCRARKTKCDNVRPTCGFCASVDISCSFDDAGKDHSTFDPASLEILRHIGQIIGTQEDLLHAVRSIAANKTEQATSILSPYITVSQLHNSDNANVDIAWSEEAANQPQNCFLSYDYFAQQANPAGTSPAASTGVAAVQWLGLLTRDVSREFDQEDPGSNLEGVHLEQFDTTERHTTTPLQNATKIVDDHLEDGDVDNVVRSEKDNWQARDSIVLLEQEQVLFTNFIHKICSWLDLFDTARKFSTLVPHLAARNAGLLNAILALSGYHQSLDESVPIEARTDQNIALQYYYQTLHYVQKAMRYSSYQHSLELMATTLIISTYEMLRGSREDWQQHLKGVFWILRSRQIEVETSSLESTTWWAWLRQDIWVAFREKRRTYSTWVPKKSYAELDSHEIALRSIWILAQVVNFCAVDSRTDLTESSLTGRIEWARALRRILDEWASALTIEFSELPAMIYRASDIFRPRLIHPQCFGLAMQIHHVSRILVTTHEPSYGGKDDFISRQKIV